MDADQDARGVPPRGGRRRIGSLAVSLGLFGLVTMALLAAVGLIFSTLRAERIGRTQVARTSQVLLALRDVGRSAINAETGQRGYLITLDRAYLAPYELGRGKYPVAMAELRRLVADHATPRQRQLIDRVEQLGDAKFGEMAQSVAMIERGEIVAAEQALLSDEGQELMERLRGTIGELETSERAALGRAIGRNNALEARIVPLLVALLGVVCAALALGLWQVARAARAEATAAQAQALGEARDRADLLARELNHRVKNIFAVILAIVRMTGKDAPEARPVVERIAQRIHALVTAHDVTQGALDPPVVELRALVETAIAPYCSASERCAVDGDPVTLPAPLAMPLGLVLHELTTNAVKYGAWSQPGGVVTVRWRSGSGRLCIEWLEQGANLPPGDGHEGFGSLLIQSSARQLGGTIERTFDDHGIAVRIELPLPPRR